VSWQDYTKGVSTPNLFRTDFIVQSNTLARIELCDAEDPADVTEAYILPPVLADWYSQTMKVLLWKSLFANYTGKFIHFYDNSGIFRKAAAL